MAGVPARVVLEVVHRNIWGSSTNQLPGCSLFPNHSQNGFLACFCGSCLNSHPRNWGNSMAMGWCVSGALTSASELPGGPPWGSEGLLLGLCQLVVMCFFIVNPCNGEEDTSAMCHLPKPCALFWNIRVESSVKEISCVWGRGEGC